MGEESDILDNRIHVRLKRKMIKHGKKLQSHIQRHHKKYTIGAAIYSIFHITIVNVLALKLLFLKIILSILALLGIYESPLMNTFAQIENICINNKSIVAQQKCEKNFSSIEEAVKYIESQIDPETNTIYNASHYSIISSMLKDDCGNKINKNTLQNQINTFKSIYKIKDSASKMTYLKQLYASAKAEINQNYSTTEDDFCNAKYSGYNTLTMVQKEFLKELKKNDLLNAYALGEINKNKSDMFILSSFYEKAKIDYNGKIVNTMSGYKDLYAQTLANIIRYKTLTIMDSTINNLEEETILKQSEIEIIRKKLNVNFIPGCDKNTGSHTINEYYSNKNVLIDTKLEKIQLNIHLCKSYQYIDELETNISKLLIHEIGHYVYTFKDTTTNRFENICRNKIGDKQYNKCTSNAFVTSYSKKNAEEDYAETFSRWAIARIQDEKSNSTNTNIVIQPINSHGSAPRNITSITTIAQKFNYFDKLLQNTKIFIAGL